MNETFKKCNGSEAEVCYAYQSSLQDMSEGEGSVDVISVLNSKGVRKRSKQFVLKKLDRTRSVFSTQDPFEQQGKWLLLRQAGVSVVPTFRVSENGDKILQTDLTPNSEREFFDPIVFNRCFNTGGALAGLTPPRYYLPAWVSNHKTSITDQIVDNSRKASRVDIQLNSDSWFFVYNKSIDAVRVIVGDLGRGTFGNIGFTKDFTFWNSLSSSFNMLNQIGLYNYNEVRQIVGVHRPKE